MTKSFEPPAAPFLIVVCLFLAFAVPPVTEGGTGPPNTDGSRTLVAVIPPDFPPTYFRNPSDGTPRGLAVDVTNALARIIGVKVKYRFAEPWEEIENLLLTGQADLIPFRVINDKTKARFIFTKPVDTTPVSYIARASAPHATGPTAGSKIGVIRGSTAAEKLKDRPDLVIRPYESMQHLFMDLLAGRIDLILGPQANILPLAQDAGLEERIRVVAPPAFEVIRSIALQPGAETLRDRLDRAMQVFDNSAEAGEIYTRWLRKPEPFWTAGRVGLTVGGGLALALIAVFLWRFVEARRMNRRLNSERAFLQTMIDIIPDPIFYKDRNGVYLGCNRSFARELFGRTKEEIVGRTDFDLLPDRSQVEFFRERDRMAMAAGKSLRNDEWFTFADGRAVLLDTIKTPFRDTAGEVAGIIGISRDVTMRDLARKAQEDARRQLQTILDNLPMVAWLKDLDGRLIMVNEAFARNRGCTVAEVIGKTDLDLWPKEEAEAFRADDRKVVETRCKREVEQMFMRESGQRWFRAFKSPIFDDQGEIVGTAGIAQDVTESRFAEEAIRESEARYRTLFETMSQSVLYQRGDGAIIDANAAALDLLGLTREELLGINAYVPTWEATYEDGTPCPAEEYPSSVALRTGKPVKDAVLGIRRPRLKDRVWIIVNATPLFHPGESVPDRVFLTLQDITERKMAEEALRSSETRYKKLFQEFRVVLEAIPDSLALISPDFKIVWANRQAEESMGWHPGGPVAGEHCYRLWHGRTEPCGECPLRTPADSDESPAKCFLSQDGRKWEFRVIPIQDDAGNCLSTLRVARDVTDQEKWESQLRQMQKIEAIGTLAGGIAHDFNNILAPIVGYSELLLLGTEESNPLRAYIQQVIAAAGRAKDLVRQILSFSHITDEQPMKPIALGPVVKETLELLRATLPTTIEIRADIGDGGALADPTQIQQVVLNLCTNAAHAMGERGTLDVSLSVVDLGPRELAQQTLLKLQPGRYTKLAVADSGCGMDVDTVQRIFEPYFTTKQVGKGTGLGLAVVHGIVKRHGGEIRVSSKPGVGSLFEVFLPCSDDDAVVPVEPRMAMPGGNERVLLVDDERVIVDLWRRILEDLGYVVTAETSAQDALDRFRSRPEDFDLVITDYTMPGLTGPELVREMNTVRPGVPAILCTGFSERLTREEALEAGIREIAMKPLGRSQLAELVRSVLDAEKA